MMPSNFSRNDFTLTHQAAPQQRLVTKCAISQGVRRNTMVSARFHKSLLQLPPVLFQLQPAFSGRAYRQRGNKRYTSQRCGTRAMAPETRLQSNLPAAASVDQNKYLNNTLFFFKFSLQRFSLMRLFSQLNMPVTTGATANDDVVLSGLKAESFGNNVISGTIEIGKTASSVSAYGRIMLLRANVCAASAKAPVSRVKGKEQTHQTINHTSC